MTIPVREFDAVVIGAGVVGLAIANELCDVFVRNGSVYVTHRNVIDTGEIIGNDCRGYLMPKERSLDVNEEMDFLFAEFLSDRTLVE